MYFQLPIEPTRSTASSAFRIMTNKAGNQFIGRYKKSKSKQHQNDLITLIKGEAMRRGYKAFDVAVPLHCVIQFAFPSVSSPAAARKRGAWKFTKPDLDNSSKVILDAFTQSGVLADDRQVCHLVLQKFNLPEHKPPFIAVWIEPLEDAPPYSIAVPPA